MRAKLHKVTILLVLAGVAGLILCFPWKFDNGSTCLADEYFNDHSIVRPVHMNYQMQMHRYLLPYGFLWWLSIAILVYVFYRFYWAGRGNRSDYEL
jgi:hypothetical protein